MSHNILFIDSNVTDYETLIAGLATDVEVYILNGQDDGVLQMADILKDRTGLDAIQILSHGSSGALALGSGVLNGDNLASYADALSQIGASLSTTGDILLYGCDVAQGEVGLSFINQLSAMTGADIAASTNLTGAADKGGNWTLEASTGQIESKALSAVDYAYTLVNPTVNISAGITPVEGAAGTFTITLDSAPASDLIVNYTLNNASTATLSTDYTVTAGSNINAVTTGSFTIAANQTTATLNINALTGAVTDPNETVIMTLATGSGYQLAATSSSSFEPTVDYGTGVNPYSVSTGDFNGDGKLDLATANDGDYTVSVLLNNGDGTFAVKVDYATGNTPESVNTSDFNGDGKLDLVVANSSSNTVSVLLGHRHWHFCR